MSRREEPKGYLQIDSSGRMIVLGAALRSNLRSLAGFYTHLPSDNSLLHFKRATTVPNHDEFRVPITLQGDIAAMGSTVEIINFVNSSQMSGNLIFVCEDVRKCLYFKNGEVRGATSNQGEDRLGEIMFRFGALTRPQLEEAMNESRRLRRPLGNLLLDRGVITQSDLYAYVRKQVEETFYSILMIAEGDFFLTAYDVDSLPSPLSLNAQSMLMEGLRRIDEMAYFRQKLPSPATLVDLRPDRPADVVLEPKAQMLIDRLPGPTPVEQLVLQCRLGEFETTKLLFHLIKQQVVHVVEAPSPGGAEVDQRGEMDSMVETFNGVFERIFQAISRHGREDALEQGLETFLQFYGFVELFQGVRFDNRGRLDRPRLLQNLISNPIENRMSFLSQALNELLFFEMFAAREWLEREEQQDLQKIINQLFIDIG